MSIVKKLNSIWIDLSHVLFPNLCIACETLPKSPGSAFCPECLVNLPFTDHFDFADNVVTKHFWGRIQINHAASLFYMREGSQIHQMIHGLKYESKTEKGIILGEMIGAMIQKSHLFPPIDIIIPIPITNKKKISRGYNQCSFICEGINSVINKSTSENMVVKIKETESQTGKTRNERVLNVVDSFAVTAPEKLTARHVLIVDDVITTGATIESCCLKLAECKVASISIVSIAAAMG